jgi:hypothetical protein
VENRYGVQGTVQSGVFFTEDKVAGAAVIRRVEADISRQNSNLSEIKEELSRQALSFGGNAVMNFKYGQKKHQWWELVFTFKWDTESWFGTGDVVKL